MPRRRFKARRWNATNPITTIPRRESASAPPAPFVQLPMIPQPFVEPDSASDSHSDSLLSDEQARLITEFARNRDWRTINRQPPEEIIEVQCAWMLIALHQRIEKACDICHVSTVLVAQLMNTSCSDFELTLDEQCANHFLSQGGRLLWHELELEGDQAKQTLAQQTIKWYGLAAVVPGLTE